ncbi:hypothetical protein CAP48_17125 [Advenella sp. S44]|uniref:aldo/keto reductase n=1 Tax=Advenella sp. S44 TaxID=1982755 RepID=UPI000C2A215A|nr:aldo/keto reductase [Advenella sp. S44]PJX21036.1 hypothetical protein CAP48_17125 [Advenella sp. S44]
MSMGKRYLGASDLEVSTIGLGCNSFGTKLDQASVCDVVHFALDSGINFFDTANIYGSDGQSEILLGKTVSRRRSEAILATKVGMPMYPDKPYPNNSRKEIIREVEGSLRRLGTSWIDLYQLHYPDTKTPIEETLRAMEDLVQQGKVRYIGCSNFSSTQLIEAMQTARSQKSSPFVACQTEYNFFSRECEETLIPTAQQLGVGIIPYFPLATGMLSGTIVPGRPLPSQSRLAKDPVIRNRFWTQSNQKLLAALFSMAQKTARGVPDLALAWLLSRSGVSTVIVGASRVSQVRQNIAAASHALSKKEISLLTSLLLATR